MFPLRYNANQHKPIIEFTPELRALWHKQCAENLSEDEVLWLREKARRDAVAARQQFLAKEHARYCVLAGGDEKHTLTVAQAKRYVRSRAGDSLQAAFEFLEDVIKGRTDVNLKDRIDVAYEIIKRSAGTATVMNAVPNVKALAELAPVDAIDSVMKAYAAGDVDEKFVSTLLGLLGAKVNGLKLEEAGAKKSAQRTGERIQKPPSGKVV